MPPSFKFTREEIINSSLRLIREQGFSALTARGLAEQLGSSPKPIFGLFSGMEEVKTEAMAKAYEIYLSYIDDAMKNSEYPTYKASGLAYIRFSKEEPQLFKLLFMRDRSNEIISEGKDDIAPFIEIIKGTLNINEEQAYIFHTQMWIYVHGIATMCATSYLEWDLDFISNSLTDIFEGLKHRFKENA